MDARIKFLRLGAAFVVTLSASAQTLNTLYSFGHNELGYQPFAVTLGPNGDIFGTAPEGGAYGYGVAFELTPPQVPGGGWPYSVLHSFNPKNGEGQPSLDTAMAMGSSGVLYGVTSYDSAGGNGTVYRLFPVAASPSWREDTLLAFTGGNGEGPGGVGPDCTVFIGPSGVLYGTATAGGANDVGVVFRLVPSSTQGGAWTEQVLYSFGGYAGDGTSPYGPLTVAQNQALFGVTQSGGAAPLGGTVFRLAPPASADGDWTESVLHSFGTSAADPGLPNGVVVGPNGELYGTAAQYLAGSCTACGSVFKLVPPAAPGGAWSETILHRFAGGNGNKDGSQPNSIPLIGPSGELYGTTYSGGAYGVGTIYRMVPPSSSEGAWAEEILYSFTGGADGAEPTGIAFGPDGNLYGSTEFGGVSPSGSTNQGTIFQLVLPQNSSRR